MIICFLYKALLFYFAYAKNSLVAKLKIYNI